MTPEAGCVGGGLAVESFILNEQPTDRATQPNQNPVTAQSASLPQSDVPMCFPDDLPTTVTINQVNNPDSVQIYEVDGIKSLRIGVDLTFTFTNANGEPIGGTVSESVEALEGDAVYQDRRDMPLVNGTVSDTVATPGQAIPSRDQERAVVENFNKPFVTRQLINVTLTTNSGMVVRVSQERTFTNTTSGARRIAGGLIGGYTFTMGQPQMTVVR